MTRSLSITLCLMLGGAFVPVQHVSAQSTACQLGGAIPTTGPCGYNPSKSGAASQRSPSATAINTYNAIQQHLQQEQHAVQNTENAILDRLQHSQTDSESTAPADTSSSTSSSNSDESQDTSSGDSFGTSVGSDQEVDQPIDDSSQSNGDQDSGNDVATDISEVLNDSSGSVDGSSSSVADDVSSVLDDSSTSDSSSSGDASGSSVAEDISSLIDGSPSPPMGTTFNRAFGHVPPSSHPGPGWFDTPYADVRDQTSVIKITSVVTATMNCTIYWSGIKLGSAAFGVYNTGARQHGMLSVVVPAYPGRGTPVVVRAGVREEAVMREKTVCKY